MIEKTLITYLKTKTNITIGLESPIKKPEKYVVLSKIDGGTTNHIKAATFSVDCYAGSLLDAAELCDTIKGYILEMVTLDTISGVSIGSEKSNINTSNKSYCYGCVVNFYYY